MTDQSNKSKKYCFDEDEFFEDESYCIASIARQAALDNCEKCVQCGFPVVPGEEALELQANGDIIHRQCLEEYIEENLDIFARVIPG